MPCVPDRAKGCIRRSGNNLEAAFQGTTQGREGSLRNVGAGRCDLKIVDSMLQLSKKGRPGTEERQKRTGGRVNSSQLDRLEALVMIHDGAHI
jgi:hypothetical protein